VRLVIARCSVHYTGRLNAHLPEATRLLVHKGDGSLLVHSDGGSYKPLNWMSPPCTLEVVELTEEQRLAGVIECWEVSHRKSGDKLRVSIFEWVSDERFELGLDPGLTKDGVESHLQELLAAQIERLGDGCTLVRREESARRPGQHGRGPVVERRVLVHRLAAEHRQQPALAAQHRDDRAEMAGIVATPGVVAGEADQQVQADEHAETQRAVDPALEQRVLGGRTFVHARSESGGARSAGESGRRPLRQPDSIRPPPL